MAHLCVRNTNQHIFGQVHELAVRHGEVFGQLIRIEGDRDYVGEVVGGIARHKLVHVVDERKWHALIEVLDTGDLLYD